MNSVNTVNDDRVARLVEKLSDEIKQHGLGRHRNSIVNFLSSHGIQINRDTGDYDADQIAELSSEGRETIELYCRSMAGLVGPASNIFRD